MLKYSNQVKINRRIITDSAFISCALTSVIFSLFLPIVVSLMGLFIGPASSVLSTSYLSFFFTMVLSTFVISLIALLVLGVPSLWVLKKRNMAYPLLSALMGGIYGFLIWVIFFGGMRNYFDGASLLILVSCGAFCGFIACFLFNKKCRQQLAD